MASDVSALEYVTDDFSTVYYIKDDSLYKQIKGADKVKIASDVYDVLKIYDSGEIYYLKDKNEEKTLMDYVIDDMEEVDAFVIEPSYPNYPSYPEEPNWWEYYTDEEYMIAQRIYAEEYYKWEEEYKRVETEYNEACTVWYEKMFRDELREEIKGNTLWQSYCSLCFYNGSEEAVITDSFSTECYRNDDYTYALNTPVITYEAYVQSEFEKVNLSQIESVYDVESIVEMALFSDCERYITVKGSATVVEQEKEATSFKINDSGTSVYYIDDIPDRADYGELYHISISKGVVGNAEVYESDVYTGYCDFVTDTEFQYFKDYRNGKCELYINKNRIDYDVETSNVEVCFELGKVFYFTDWSDNKDCGILMAYNGKESVKIADDVHSFVVMPNGCVLYLYDYSTNYNRGELYRWSNGVTCKLDDDVLCVLPILDNKYRGVR